MYVFGTVEASAALRPYCGCSVLPGGEGTTKAGGGAGGNEAVWPGGHSRGRPGAFFRSGSGWVSTEAGRVGSTEAFCC